MKELKELRKLLGLTQEEMAKELKISRSLYTMIEIGKRKPNTNFIKKLKDRYPFIDVQFFLR
jgi:transcriptional regulator with XRE-family HTH domain